MILIMSQDEKMFEDIYEINIRPTTKQSIIQLTNNQKIPNSNIHKINALISEIDDMLRR